MATARVTQPRKQSMTLHQTRKSSRIARRAVKQGARPVNVTQVAVEKSTTESQTRTETAPTPTNPTTKVPLLKGKNGKNIGTLNVQTLNKESKVPELISSAETTKHDIICLQEHRFVHEDLVTKEESHGTWKLITCSAWKNSVNSSTGGIGMLISSTAYKALGSVEKISPRIMVATFNGNPKTTVICCYSPTNVTDETEVENFYADLSSVTRQVPKHNILLIGGDFNAHLGQKEGFKHAYHDTTNRNGNMLKDFLMENNLLSLNTKFQRRRGQLWTHDSPNGSKAQLDYIIINKKWQNSARNCRAYNSFVTVSSDHRIVTAKIQLSLRANKKKTSGTIRHDWSHLANNPEISDKFIVSLKNRFAALQESDEQHTATARYKNFEIACKEAANKIIPPKERTKKRKAWESEEISRLRKEVQDRAKLKNTDPSNDNKDKFKAAQTKLTERYEKEQAEFLQTKIDTIEQASCNKKSALAWKTVNEVSGRRSASTAKLKATSEEERLKLWRKHFEDLLGSTPKIKEATITPVVETMLNIKTGSFEMYELIKAQKQVQNGKASALDNIPPEVWKKEEMREILLGFCNDVYNQEPIESWVDGCLLPFPKKGDLGLTSNYRGITLTPIAAKVYNLMLLNRIRPAVEKVLRKNQNGFRPGRSTAGQILTIRRILEGAKSKNLPIVLLFIDFSKAFDSIHRGKMKEILLAYGIPEETVAAIMMLYQNTRSMVRSPDGDTDFFDIIAGVLQGDTLAPYLFIICLDYVLRKALDSNEDLGFTLKETRSRRYPAVRITDVDYADDLAVLTNNTKDAMTLLHKIEEAASEIGLYVNAKKTEYIILNIDDESFEIRDVNGNLLKVVKDFKYLGSYIASTEKDIEIRLGKAWGALNQLDDIWKSNLPNRLKRNFFRAAVESVLVYGSTAWTLTTALENKLDGAYTRMLRAALNVSWKDHMTNKELYGSMVPISLTIKEQRMRFAGHVWRNKEELASDVLLWKPTHGRQEPGRPRRTFIDQLADDTGCKAQELPNAMNNREEWRKRVMLSRASSIR